MFHVKHISASWILSAALVSLAPSVASAQENRLYVAGGADVWTGAEPSGHGYALVTYQRSGRHGLVDVTYNTDTLWAAIDGVPMTSWLALGGMLKGQLGYAGLLPDYYDQGEGRPERGFNASYMQGRMWGKVLLDPHYIELELGARRWSFASNDATSKTLTLPSVGLVWEPRLRYTLWLLGQDAAIHEPHRHMWRQRGLALGAEAGVDVRDVYAPFGALDEGESRNAASEAPRYGLVWLKAGRQVTERVRVQTTQLVMAGQHMDDLNRWRIGGLNPYVAPVAGLPWAAYLLSNFWHSEVSAAVRVAGEHEVGLMWHMVRMSGDDVLRRGDGEWGGLGGGFYGGAVYGDLRFGPWQIEAKLGATRPDNVLVGAPYLGGWLSAGYQLF
jgi:hypothetical protein